MQILDEMCLSQIQANTVTYSSAVSALEKPAAWEAVLEILQRMERSQVQRNAFTFNAAISAFGKAERWQQAVSLLADMLAGEVEADIITCTSAIDACARGARWQRALAIAERMARQEVAPNDFTSSALLNACARGAAWDAALALLDACPQPTPSAYAAALSAAGDAGAWEAALALLRQMAGARLMATGVEFGSFLRGAPAAQREELLRTWRAAYFGPEAAWTELFGGRRDGVFGPVPEHRVDAAGPRCDPHLASAVQVLAEAEGLVAAWKPAGLSTDDALGVLAARRGRCLTRASRLDLPTSGVVVGSGWGRAQ
ncbi:unnamed protein product [Symbiodinium natans]|uniref:Pentatricopeptide repeat-containing protein, chloroplastic n=1 Tax=Symbiodinium natans TaxID=878477 RepID=A0A812GYV1_9DINO|nr:unnamed protein product [Symbiodinium natans]